ncbi:hypothetical protein BKA59DRAFT_459034 [Fusarium tricinctum]|uniref:Uncharacterized protein n=1 Tax=Fusarium tricinctum TaxID=61284 RepID=A0A8K0RMN5_9HYPO|nr:hypothetical protein BKA59DRAFT_459034 [Fusarium tricinctum]
MVDKTHSMNYRNSTQPMREAIERCFPRRGKPYNFAGPSHSKARVYKGEGKELNINEVISGLRHMQKKIYRKSLLSQLTQNEYDEFIDGQETIVKILGTQKIADRAEVNATPKWKGLPFGSTENLLRHSANTQSSNSHIQRQARHRLARNSTPIAETSRTKFEPIDNEIHSEVKMRAFLDSGIYANNFPRQTRMLLESSGNDDRSTDNAQKNENALTQDQRLKDKSLKSSPPSHVADDNSFADQCHDMLKYMQRSCPHEHPYLDLMQHVQTSSASTGHSISFHHLSSKNLRQRYRASLSDIRAVQNYGRRGVPVDIRKDKTFEKLSNAFSASGHYTISQDHTAGEETRRSHLLANFGRRHGASTDERQQLKMADHELNSPAIDMESVSIFVSAG